MKLQRDNTSACKQRDELQAALVQVEQHHQESTGTTDALDRENRALNQRIGDADRRANDLIHRLQDERAQLEQ